MTPVQALVRTALLDRRPLRARYGGHVRELCPHVLGTKNGRPQALFYQSGGTSRSGLAPPGSPQNWRCLPLDRLEDVEITTGTWQSAPNASRPQTCVDTIDVAVEITVAVAGDAGDEPAPTATSAPARHYDRETS